MKLIIIPEALVSKGSVRIVKFTKSVHLIILPVSLIVATFRENKLSKTFPPTFHQATIVSSLEMYRFE